MNQDNTEKSISEDFTRRWQSLSHNQQRFAVVMVECSTKKEAAELVGLQANTVYGWPDEIDEIVEYLRNESAAAALGIVQANATKAAMVKTGGLDSDNEKIRQDAATEVLDRTLGKPTQRQELTGAGGKPLVVEYVNDWRHD